MGDNEEEEQEEQEEAPPAAQLPMDHGESDYPFSGQYNDDSIVMESRELRRDN